MNSFKAIIGATITLLAIGCQPGGSPSVVSKTPSQKNAVNAQPEHHYSKQLTEAGFENDVLKSSGVVLVDFWAPWCQPCVALGPTIEELAKEYEGKAVVAKLNVDEAQAIAQKYNIQAIPAMLFFKNGEVVETIVGGREKSELAAKLDSLAQ